MLFFIFYWGVSGFIPGVNFMGVCVGSIYVTGYGLYLLFLFVIPDWVVFRHLHGKLVV